MTAHRAVESTPIGPDFPNDILLSLQSSTRGQRRWLLILIVLVLAGVGAWVVQVITGLRATGLGDLVFWGVYMANFIFFIGISYAGTLISAILRITGAEWRRPITRLAEVITVVALFIGAAMIIVDMGRPDRLHHIPEFGRVQSPILWDVFSISTYLAGSILYLYVALIPDLAILAGAAAMRGDTSFRTRVYRRLSLGYRGTPEQERQLDRAVAAMAVILIPVAISAHSVVAWIFGMTLRPGWHSTIFAPYFVVGAIFSGTAALILAMALSRRAFKLEHYLTRLHFRYMGWILLALTLVYAYFTFAEYLTAWYGGMLTEGRLLKLLLGPSAYGVGFWLTAILGLLLPALLLAFPGSGIRRVVIASVLVVIGMWIKRYLIVVPTLLTPFLPPEAADMEASYVPSIVEWLITLGGFAGLCLLFTLFAKRYPLISVWEVGETDERVAATLRDTMSRTPPDVGKRPVAVPAPTAVSLLLVASLAGGVLDAQTVRPVPDSMRIGVVHEKEGNDDLLIVTVLAREKPVEGARVEFFVRRRFGLMTLGGDVTLDDGTAAVNFPVGLKGDSTGTLEIVVQLAEPTELEGIQHTERVGGEPLVVGSEPFPRALWAPSGPVGMLWTIAMLLALVWGTYAFVLSRLVKIFTLSRTP
jgi:molybdopterin-containing oxidoreductase family membrane subunit